MLWKSIDMILLKFKLPISNYKIKTMTFLLQLEFTSGKNFQWWKVGNMFLCCFGVPLFYLPILSNMFFHLFFSWKKWKEKSYTEQLLYWLCVLWAGNIWLQCTIMRAFFIRSVNEKFFRDVKLIFRNVLKICILVWTFLPAVSLLQWKL